MTELIQELPAAEEEAIELRGARFEWSRAGAGPVAIYAHALSHDRDSLAGPGGLLDLSPVAGTRALIRYDARGHGRSSGRQRTDDYAQRELATDLLDLAAVWSPSDPVAGIGTSLGTATLLHAATRTPERFEKLVLTAPPTAWLSRAGQADAYEGLANAIETNGLESMMDILRTAATPPILRDAPPLEPRITEELLPTILRGVATSDLPDPAAIAELRMPVLILSWADDPAHPVATGQRLNELIPGSTFCVAKSRTEIEGWPALIADFLGRSTTSRSTT
jgi:3-oxoadipate enol-lactonase